MKTLPWLVCISGVFLAGCTSWKEMKQPPPVAIADKHPRVVRVTMADGRCVTLSYPLIEGDSLAGFRGQTELEEPFVVNEPEDFPRVALALSDIRRLEWLGPDRLASAGIALGIGVAAGVLATVLIENASTPSGRSAPSGTPVSCPLLYSQQEAGWQLDSGTYGGAILEPLSRTDVDNLEHARPIDGWIRLRMTDEARETEFVDAISLLAVDHDSATGVAPDADGRICAFGALARPLRARDFRGCDVLPRVADEDGRSWESALRFRDPTRAEELRDGIVVEFAKPRDVTSACLVVTGHNTPWVAYLVSQMVQAHGSDEPEWQRWAKAHPEDARAAMQKTLAEGMLEVSLDGPQGWQRAGLVWEAGPEVAKQQVVRLALTPAMGDTIRIRLSSVPSFWLIDRVALAPTSEVPTATQAMPLASASDSTGRDLLSLLRKVDGRSYRMTSGTAAALSFADPPRRAGLLRSYLARTSGWYRVICDTTRAPDLALLARLEHEPHAAARMSVERANQALQLVREGSR